jgi:hypothetical protein
MRLAANDPEDNLPPTEKNLAAIEMLQAWAKEDEAMTDEESAENEAILRAINENRVSIRNRSFKGKPI